MRHTLIAMAGLALVGCQNEKDPYRIGENHVGLLDRTTRTEKVDEIFATDSIVRDTRSFRLGDLDPRIKIYESGGKHLLTLTPGDSTIENIHVHDPRFLTEEGIGLNSTFGEIQEAYTIDKIITSMKNLVVFVKESDVYFTISRDQLPENLRYSTDLQIEAVQIPDRAKVKYVMVGWEPTS